MTPKSSAKNTRFSKSRLAFAIAAHMFAAGNAVAGPSGGEVVGGVGNINQQGSATTITQTTDRMAIDWQSFDIGKDERVTFVQPGQSAVALNRILSNNGSEILGQIDANGHVILVNPHGVVFGEGAVINAGGLIASGLQINPDDFMNGDLVFKRIEGTDGTVINAGMINAASGGNVALVGTQVENRGLISARLGSVTLASGKEAVLTFDESGLLGVQVDEAILQSELGDKAAITNSGEINAEGGRILLSASTTRDVFSQAVNWGDQKQARSVTYNDDGSFTLGAGGDVVNSGEITVSGEIAGNIVALGENITSTGKIHADATQGVGGNVELHSNTTTIISEEGIVTANAEHGGDIKVLGKNVGLFDSSSIEAIGENGGGQILVGGDQEGLNNQVRNADFVYINEKASINASATSSGDGGRTIVFAEDTARIHGNLSARGGETKGNGGFVETSGKKSFSITASPDVSAVNGVAGSWLIDPYDIEVVGGEGGDDDVLDELVFESSPEVGSKILAGIINKALDSGNNVTLKTGPTGGQDGNIAISSAITLTENKNVTLGLIAHNNIEIKENITAEPTAGRKLNVNLSAGGNVVLADRVKIETSGGDFVIGEFDANKFVSSNVKEVKFGTNATVDVTGEYSDDELAEYFPDATRSLDGLAPSGRILIGAVNDIAVGNLRIKGRDSVDGVNGSLHKIKIVSEEGSITFNKGFAYDNNPTEKFSSSDHPNDGYSTISLTAGSNINIKKYDDVQGRAKAFFAERAGEGDERPEHQDRLHIVMDAGGSISIDGDIQTRGGDFEIVNAASVNLSNRILDTSSIVNGGSDYGAGNVLIKADGDVSLGSMPMFSESASRNSGVLRDPSLTAEAGGKLNIGGYNLFSRKNFDLTAADWEFNDYSLNTVDGGSINLTAKGGLDLPTINSSGGLNVVAKGHVTQRNNSSLKIAEQSSFALEGGNLSINKEGNVFNGLVWVSGAESARLATGGDLKFGGGEGIMAIAGTLEVSAKNIGQSSAIKVAGETALSADDNITLDGENQLSMLKINKAKTAKINNSQTLMLGEIKVTNRLDIAVVGDLTQRSALNVNRLVLNVSGVTSLAEIGNQINVLSGTIAGGEIATNGMLRLGEFNQDELSLTGRTTITAYEVDVDNPVLLRVGATLTLNDIGNFTLSRGFKGEDAKVNSVTVNGGGNNGTYTISQNASWEDVKLVFNGAGSGEKLKIEKDGPVIVALSADAISNESPGRFLVALNIETIEARSGSTNTLIGASSSPDGYEWTINGRNEGTVRDFGGNQQVKFINFDELVGGKNADHFRINNGASIKEIRGGDGEDTLDYSNWSGALTATLGEEFFNIAAEGQDRFSQIEGIEILVGNGAGATLQAASAANTWHIGGAENNIIKSEFSPLVDNEVPVDGELPVDERPLARQMEFRDFGTLKGGTGADTFLVNLDGKASQYTLDGGAGVERDVLEFVAGGEGWQGTYQIKNGNPYFSFTSPTKASVDFTYSDIESIALNANLDLMTLTGSSGSDTFFLGPQYWQWNTSPKVAFSQLLGLRVEAGSSDTIDLTGTINLPESLVLQGGRLRINQNARLEADRLMLAEIDDVVYSDGPLKFSVNSLTLKDNRGALDLQEDNGVELAGLTGENLVKLMVLQGDLTQSDAEGVGPIDSAGALDFATSAGAIRLDRRDNQISGLITLTAGTEATVYASSNLKLGQVRAPYVSLETSGSISSTAAFVAEDARFVSGDYVRLDSKDNDFYLLAVDASNDVDLTDVGEIFLFNSTIGGDLTLRSDWIHLVDSLAVKGDAVLDASGIEFWGVANFERDLSLYAEEVNFQYGSDTKSATLKTTANFINAEGMVFIIGDYDFGNALITGDGSIQTIDGEIRSKSKIPGLARMIEVESLADIDPAIFTNVKNYFYQDISIQLPSDQLYEQPGEDKPLAKVGNF